MLRCRCESNVEAKSERAENSPPSRHLRVRYCCTVTSADEVTPVATAPLTHVPLQEYLAFLLRRSPQPLRPCRTTSRWLRHQAAKSNLQAKHPRTLRENAN